MVRWEGKSAATLGRLLDVPRLELLERTPSTMDVAHALAADGAPAGTLVLADEQTAGRGRSGRTWRSAPGSGIWMTLLERPNDAAGVGVLSLRLGLRAAPVLDRFSPMPVRLKWPNDVIAGGRKLAGILVESRWRGEQVDWIAIGVGLNVRPPDGDPEAAALVAGTSRLDVLSEVLPSLRAAARARGSLTAAETRAWDARDAAAGRRCHAPVPGTVRGIALDGSLIIDTGSGEVHARSGSLILEEDT